MAEYAWKHPVLEHEFKIPAAEAAEEVHRLIIENKRPIKTGDIVKAAEPETAPLHPTLEWDDEVAADKYRHVQAGKLIRGLVVVRRPDETNEPSKVRAFYRVKQTEERPGGYVTLRTVQASRELRDEQILIGIKSLLAFKRRFGHMTDTFGSLIATIDDLMMAEGLDPAELE